MSSDQPDFRERQEILKSQLENRINELDDSSQEACVELAREAAEYACRYFFEYRFGVFQGENRCIVFSNMGNNNIFIRDTFRRALQAKYVTELAVANYSPPNELAYTWAVLLDNFDGEYWVNQARESWLTEHKD